MGKTHVLLMSPGIDSYISNWLIFGKNLYSKTKLLLLGTKDLSSWILLGKEVKDDKFYRVYFNIDSKYSEEEQNFLEKKYGKYLDYINYDFRLFMGDLELEDAHVPNRNLLFCSLAQAKYNADYIYINSTKCDRVEDGSQEFRKKLSELLSITANKTVKVISLLDDKEKAEWVYFYYLTKGTIPYELLEDTYSCFSEIDKIQNVDVYKESGTIYEMSKSVSIKECLNCSACFRKMSTLTMANIYVPFYNTKIINKYKDTIKSKAFEFKYPKRYESICKYLDFLSTN